MICSGLVAQRAVHILTCYVDVLYKLLWVCCRKICCGFVAQLLHSLLLAKTNHNESKQVEFVVKSLLQAVGIKSLVSVL